MANKRRNPPSGAFAGRLMRYLAYKRDELGHRATAVESFFIPNFDRYCRERFPEKQTLDMELAIAWVSDGEGTVGTINRASFIREFARYLILNGEEAFLLPNKVSPVRRGASVPHIFTQGELDAFFGAADTLKPHGRAGIRHIIAPVYFRLLRCTGLRPYEGRTLTVDRFDLDNGIIHILDSKGRDRDVPVKKDVAEMCREYSRAVEAVFPGRTPFFPHSTGIDFWPYECMLRTFNKCWEEAGMTEFSGPSPTPYDFRHFFATDCIRRWKAEGVDIDANIKFLQEYMGHRDLESTLYYVHLVRGGFGDPLPYTAWEPSNRMREEGYRGES